MGRQQLCAGVLLLALGVSTAIAAPTTRASRAGTRGRGIAAKRVAPRRAVKPKATRVVARKPTARMAAARPVSVRGRRVVRPLRRTLWAQAATGDGAGLAPRNGSGQASMAPATITREAEPLMVRALGAYYVTGERPIRELRDRGWSFGDIATAGNLAARSGRSFYEVARSYEDRRDWTRVAQDLNVPSENVYVALNAPRYIMVRPTPEEESQMIASAPPVGAEGAVTPTAPGATATDPSAATPGVPSTSVTPGTPPTATTPGAPGNASAAPGTPQAPVRTVTPGTRATPGTAIAPPSPVTPSTRVSPSTPAPAGAAPGTAAAPTDTPTSVVPDQAVQPSRIVMTPAERVAAARLELAPNDSSTILRHAAATYYALPTSTVRDLESRGWTLSDILIAGNLAHRSEASFEEIVVLHDAGQDWSTIAGRIGVAAEDLYQPPAVRRVTTTP